MTLTLPFLTRSLGRAITLLVLLLGTGLLAQAQTTRYVKPTATGNGSGSSWANASGNLQAMINASVATDQVWVAGGTYKPTTGTDRNVSFAMKIGVLIYGGFAGSETSLSQRPVINTTTPSSTTLSGDIGNAGSTADNSYHVISNPMDLINTAVLDGFIITGGNANGGSSAGSGGGMYNPGNDSGLGASPTVRNCSFQGNSAGIGGAMTNYGSATSNPVLVNCLFRANSAIQGGAIYNYKNSGAVGNPVLTNCSFQNNSASTSGGAIFNLGNFSNCAPVLTNCSFQYNSAPQGGAFYNDGVQFYSRPQLNNCVLFGNGGSNTIRNSPDSYVEAIYSLFEADAAFTNGFLGSNVSGVTVNPFASTNSMALNACAPAINSGNGDVYNQYNGTPTDLAGNARFYAGGQIDMGAVEFQAAPQSITITPPSASFATIGTTFNQTFSASGGSGPYILASGSLPPGITLATSGVLSGTPTQFGSYTFAVKVADPVTGCSGLSAPYTLSVRSDRPIRYVKMGGTGNGDSWATASGDLQSQINVAGADQVWVAAGTYKPGPAGNTDRIISFAMRGGVAIYGGFVGNETALSNRPAINPVRGTPSTTILSGDIGVVGNNADNSYHVILNRDGLTSTAILDGFVITGGNANRDGYSYEGGGGMANICQPPAGAISPTVRNCSFQGNTATHGGAIFNGTSGGQQECNPTLINCVFQDNSAGSGGAVSNNASNGTFCSPQFDNCYFINNTADNGGAMENFSGSRSQSNVRLTNCLFQGNSATSTGTGGAIYNAASGGSSYPVLINCSFQGNSIKAGAGSRLGGAIYFSTSGDITNAMLTNCSFQGNTASQGGAIYVESYQANSTTNINLISCVVFGNGGDGTFLGGRVAQDRYGLIYLSNTLIEASATRYQDRGGNILTNTSPFASPNSPELAANSPAVNAGTSDVQGTDVAGNPRIVGCRIDMGAYEFQYDPAVAITAQPAASSVVCGRASVSVPVGVSGQYLTYQWYKDSFANPVAGQTSATLTLANIQPANAGSYSLVVTGSCNSLTSTAFTLTVNQPTVSISPGSATICQGKSVLLTASGASTYTWSNTTTGNTLTATTAGTYSVTGVDGNGCTNFATAVVTENKPTVSISPVSATICQGKSVLLTASGASTYTWSNNTTDNPLTATTAGTYSVTGVDGNGCFNSATATITENKPTVSISPNPASICQAPSVLLTASGASTYTWSNNTTSNTLSATTVGTYSVTGVAANGCFNSATATVTDTRPIVSITATPSATVTQGASITLTASGTGATSFAWSSGSTGNSTVINPATSAPYSVTVRNGAGCITVASLDITVTPVVCGPVIYVTQTGSGQRDGSSWANALGSSQLQFGINTAADCGNNGQVWVAAGTYKPTTGNDRGASFALRNGVTIYGGFVGNETALTDRPSYNPVANRPASTTLSGDIGTVGNTSDNSFRVISNPASLSLTATAVLDGFVITGGAGGTLGGGMFNDGSSPTLRNCSFVSNSVSVSGSTISRGGAIYNGNSSSPQLYNCYFLNNSASSLAGVNGFGGAMANLNSSNPQLTNCNFVNNRVSGDALNQGGAIANNLNSSPQLINCSFLNNSASGGTSSRGGAVANGNVSNPQLINCSFLNNSVSGATSSTSNQGGAVYNGLSTPQLTNCVLFGNGGANTFYNANGGSVVDYSLLETTVVSFTAGTGNLTTDVSPFVSAADTRLNGCSPAINAGDNGANTTTTDLDGNPRIYAGTLARIDMGAYEYQGVAGVVTTVPTVNTATVGVPFSQNFTASGGSGPYSYSLASGSLPSGLSLSNTGVLSGTPTQTGSFTITVSATNASSCLGVSVPYVLTIIDAASPAPTLAGFFTSQGAVCVGSVATFTATVGNVTGSYGYTLTNGLTTPVTGTATTSTFSQSITTSGTGPQTFTLTVSANGLSVSRETSLTVNALPLATLTSSGPLNCTQSSVTLTAGGGSSYTFTSGNGVLGTPGSTNTLTVSTPGTYSVTVANASGCVSTTSISVTANQTTPLISIAPSSATLSCASPTVSLTAVGTGSVRWSTGETTPIISVSTAATYSVTLTSENGCSAVASTSVSQDNTAPVASLMSSGSLTCSVTSVTLTASPGGQRYTFSNGATQVGSSNQAVVNASGTYSVTVVSANGCSSVASTSVSADQSLPTVSISPSSATLSCASPSVSLTAIGTGLVRWSRGEITPVISVTTAATYSVTLTSANGCTAVASTSVGQDNTAPVASLISSGSLTCAVTSVTLTASPSGLSYVFSGPGVVSQSGNTAVVNASGLYSVTVVSANGCSSVASTSVGQDNTAPVASLISSGSLSCSVTSVTLTASPSGLSYVFSGPGVVSQSGNTAVVNASGLYSVTVASANGCSSVASVSVSQDNTAPVASLVSSGSLTCSVTSVTLTASPNGQSYRFSSSGVISSTGNTAVVNASGTYSVTVVNSNGCSSVASISVSQDNTAPVASLVSSGSLSCSVTSVTLTASPSGLNYIFSGPGVVSQSGNTVVVNASGTYSVTVVSASNGCSSVASTSVSQDNTAPVASLVSSGSLTCSVTSVTLTASAGGQSYRFSGGANQLGSSNQAVVSIIGLYSVTVVSANGCSAVASVSVGQDQTAPVASLVSSGTLSCAVTSVTLTASPIGLSYRFGGGANQLGSSNQAVVSVAGPYSVTVLSVNGCSSVASMTVAGDVTVPEAGLTNNGPISCLMSLVTLTARGGDAYRFSNGATQVGNGPTAAVSTAGVYSVTVVSVNGCTATASTTVVSDQGVPTASLTTNGTISCSTTSVTLTASPSGQGYQFSEGAIQIGSSNQAVVSTSGLYSVTVLSANGCSSVASVSVGQDNTPPVASLVSSGSLTCSVTSVTLTANPNGQRYVFSSGATQIGSSNQAVVNASGIYSVTVLSANGCTRVAQTTVEADQTVPTVSITPSSTTLSCASPTLSLTAVGRGSVRWSTGETTPSILVRAAGTYSVTLTSGNGCTASANVVIGQDQQVPTASIQANPSLTIAQGQSSTLTASASGSPGPLGFRWSTGEITPSIAVSATGPYSVSIIAPNGCSATASVVLSLTSGPIVEAPFAITAVTTLNCTPILPNRYSISFAPRYSGLTGQPVAFRVVNELLPTTEPGPYTIQLYTDNPRISLGAVQTGTSGEVTYAYDWLAACLASTAANTPPRLVTAIPPQSATVGVGYSYVIPQGTFTDDQTPGSLRLSAQGLPPGISLSGYTLSGVASTTVGSPFRVILTATDPGNLSVSTGVDLVVAPAPVEPPQPSQPFAITGVSMLSCTPIADRININFSPRYAGLTGQPVAFRIENELAATNEPGPYSLTLYRDNPVISLKATQTGSAGETSFAYNWLAACATQGQDNTPPRVVSPVGNQTVVAGTGVDLNLANVFLDQETPQGLSLSVTGLPSGLALVGTAIQGVASTTSVSTVVVTATDGGGLSASTSFTLTVTAPVSPTVGEPGNFTITGVQTLSCVVVSGGQRAVTFQPQYRGTTGGPITFSVINERAATNDPGPYTLSLYTDNPTITLSAQQGNAVATYRYNWLSGCTPAARVGSGEAGSRLTVRVLGNPVEGNTAEVEIRGVSGQAVQLNLVDLQGKLVYGQRIEQAGAVERVSLPLGVSNGVLLLQVSTPTQHQQVKLLRTN